MRDRARRLTPQGCRRRVERLRDWCRRADVDLAVISDEKDIYYFSSFLRKPYGWLKTRVSIWGCFRDGTTFLLCSRSESRTLGDVFADHIVAYPDYDIQATTQTFLEHALKELAVSLKRLGRRAARVALEDRYAPVALRRTLEDLYPGAVFEDCADAVLALRRRKDPDEVAVLEETADVLGLCYRTAGEVATPGRTDVDVYAACCAAYARELGEYVTLAGDFLAGDDTFIVTGGPTGRRLEAGQTLILDLWIDPFGYWIDNSRTFIVGGSPRKEQEDLYRLVIACLAEVEDSLRPGVPAREVYHGVRAFFEKAGLAKNLPGHAGHGIGLSPHEAPLLIPASADRLEAGDVCCVEPQLYVPGVGGVRCEDNYLVTEDGPRRLSGYERRIGWP